MLGGVCQQRGKEERRRRRRHYGRYVCCAEKIRHWSWVGYNAKSIKQRAKSVGGQITHAIHLATIGLKG